jgi:hypothetical protein
MKTNSRHRWVKNTLAAIAAMFLGNSVAHAQATRTWVSGVGDDANPCSRTAPCKTFAGAISKTASAGEINVLDPGGFGAVTISKSMSIDGGGFIAGVLVSGTNGIIINAGANDVVTLRHLDFNGVGSGLSGVLILQAAEVNIEDCVIYEFATHGVFVNNSSNACRVNIKNCVIRGCANGAVHAQPGSAGAVVNITNSHLNASLYGFRAESTVRADLDHCNLSGNSNNGALVVTSTTGSLVNINDCLVADNGSFGLVSVGTTAAMRISNNTISGNGTGIAAQTSGQLISFGNNRIKGNTTDTSAAPTSTISQQ